MEKVKEMILPEGWVVDKIENGKIILKEDNSKPVIKWNDEKDGVEVKADGFNFIIANMPNISSNWYDAQTVCEKYKNQNGYLPTVDELKVAVKYFKEINQCFDDNNGYTMNKSDFYWSSSEYSSSNARLVNTYDGNAYSYGKSYDCYVRAWFRS